MKRISWLIMGWLMLLSTYPCVGEEPSLASDKFRMIEGGSRKEPKPDELYATYILPRTSIKAGIYDYVTDSVIDKRELGFLVDSTKFFYIDGEYYSIGDVHYGLIGNYFVVDGWEGDGSHPSRILFLCQFDKTSVKLLDVIKQGYVKSTGINFASVTNDTRDPWKFQKNPAPSWMEIQDVDHDGIPEIKLQIEGYDFFLYMEIVDGHFSINFNPDLYVPLFDNAKQRISASKRKRKTHAYYFYGFLSKKLDIKDIRLELRRADSRAGSIVSLLENIGQWDAGFHDVNDEHFTMKQLDLKQK